MTRELSQISQRPELLIPDQFGQFFCPDQLKAVPLKLFGIRDRDFFQIPLAVLICAANYYSEPVAQQEKDNPKFPDVYNWERTINNQRQNAIQRNEMTPLDKALLLLMVDETYPDGVKVISFSLISELRGKGLGRAFFNRWGEVLSGHSFRFWWGEHNPNNAGFFFDALGNYSLADLKPEAFSPAGVLINPKKRREPYNSIQFIDAELEKKCVLPDLVRR